jgi:hypothetical protein
VYKYKFCLKIFIQNFQDLFTQVNLCLKNERYVVPLNICLPIIHTIIYQINSYSFMEIYIEVDFLMLIYAYSYL